MLLGLDTRDVFKWTQAVVDFAEVQFLRITAEKQGTVEEFQQLYIHPQQAQLEKKQGTRTIVKILAVLFLVESGMREKTASHRSRRIFLEGA